MSTTSVLMFWFVIFFLLGGAWYIFDRSKGQKLYRWWHNLTHENELSAEEAQGFIFKRKTSPRFSVAVFLSVVQVGIIAFFTHETLLTFIMIWFFGIPALMLGFILGPIIDRLWKKKETVFAVIDSVESGETKIGVEPMVKAARTAVGSVFERGREVLNPQRERERESVVPPTKVEAPTTTPPKDPPIDGRQAIKDFTGKE